MKSVSISVTGKVKGVLFRASAKEIAESLNIKGLAQNQSDGSVYIEAEGDEESLQKFVEWCKHGPARAQVTNVDVQESELKNFERFEIRR
jgi:acylphosphatase